jgi:hypothetical protein
MDFERLIELLSYTIPALITGAVALYFFKFHTDNEEKRRNFLLVKEKQNKALPLQLQAYERMALFLERISPEKLLIRVKPNGKNALNYQNKLILSIDQEYEHNLAQQIYMSETCWNAIVAAKNATIQLIRMSHATEGVETSDDLREKIIQNTMENDNPTKTALSYLKEEVRKIF